MSNTPASAPEQKPASPANPNPQQPQQDAKAPGTDKPAGQPQQK